MRVNGEEGPVGLRVGPHTTLPDVCFHCGRPTRRRVRLKLVGPKLKAEKREPSVTQTALGCVPQVGCLFSLLLQYY